MTNKIPRRKYKEKAITIKKREILASTICVCLSFSLAIAFISFIYIENPYLAIPTAGLFILSLVCAEDVQKSLVVLMTPSDEDDE